MRSEADGSLARLDGERMASRPRPPLRLPDARAVAAILPYLLPPLLAAVLGAIAWEVWVRVDDVSPFVMPRPTEVAHALFDDLGGYAREGLRTFWVATGGLLLGSAAAVALAIAMVHSRLLERALMPLAIGLKVTPIIAWAPLFVIWFGFGWEPKVAVAALLTYFPVLINATAGFRDVEPRALDFLRSVHASGWEIFTRLRTPSALPYLFAALKIAVTLSLIGAVVGEFFAAGQGGLGSVIVIEERELRLDRLFAAVFVLAVIGVLMYATIALLERLTLSWHRSSLQALG